MSFNWKATLATVAPAIAGYIGTPIAGLAVKAGLAAFGISGADIPANEADAESLLASKVKSATPDDLLKLQKENNRFQESMAQLKLDESKLFVADTADAREKNSDNDKVFWLGIVVLLVFAGVIIAALAGAYQLLIGGMIIKDAGIAATVFTLIGTLVGYVAANAQQVIAFFFGSSKGSKEKTDAMAAAFRQLK